MQPLTYVYTGNDEMKLYLMRHGEALSPQRDPERGLTDKGKSNVELVAKHLQNKDVSFSQIFHSKKKRARETAEIMGNIIAPNIKLTLHDKITPNDDPHLIFSEINSWEEDTLIASHLPFVPDLMTLLTEKDAYMTAITFETATVICLEKENSYRWDFKWSTAPTDILHG